MTKSLSTLKNVSFALALCGAFLCCPSVQSVQLVHANTFIPNEQSIFDGVQKGYVNVGKGNVTFMRRDMVTGGKLPITFARVYDSSFDHAGDFGHGWHLSLAETIKVADNGTLHYRDNCATTHVLTPATYGFSVNPAENGEIASAILDASGLLQVVFLDGRHKQFRQFDQTYRLIGVSDKRGNQIRLHYANEQLSRISSNDDHYVAIVRDNSGRITSITDGNNRFVSYHYSQQGLLDTVDDLAGFNWHYQYHANRLLHKVVDPVGQPVAMFRFDKDQKATTVKIRKQKHSYRYKGQQTLVKDAKGKTTTFSQNANGITTSVTSNNGFINRIVLQDGPKDTKARHE